VLVALIDHLLPALDDFEIEGEGFVVLSLI
jgi:hypothetical protein